VAADFCQMTLLRMYAVYHKTQFSEMDNGPKILFGYPQLFFVGYFQGHDKMVVVLVVLFNSFLWRTARHT